jgi:hypothetical protein
VSHDRNRSAAWIPESRCAAHAHPVLAYESHASRHTDSTTTELIAGSLLSLSCFSCSVATEDQGSESDTTTSETAASAPEDADFSSSAHLDHQMVCLYIAESNQATKERFCRSQRRLDSRTLARCWELANNGSVPEWTNFCHTTFFPD